MQALKPVLLPFAKRFVAGETVDDAVAHIQDLNAAGVHGLVDILGEHVDTAEQGEAATDDYISLLNTLDEHDLDAALSFKLTHLGLNVDYEACRDNVERIVAAAAERDRRCWIDMESNDHTDETVQLYTSLAHDYDNIGVTIQCMLHRAEQDLHDVLDVGGTVRLVKGAYDEPLDVAYRDPDKIRGQYRKLLETLFNHGKYVAVATHDESLIRFAQELEDEYDRDRDTFEFQSLMGVRDGREKELAAEGYTVGEYVPYGPEWWPYYKRRLQERKHLLLGGFGRRS